MTLGVGRGQRRFTDASQAVQRRDRGPALVTHQRGVDRSERVVAAEEVARNSDRNIREGEPIAGKGNCPGSLGSRSSLARKRR